MRTRSTIRVLTLVGAVASFLLNISAHSQPRGNTTRCLSISDTDCRVECLESSTEAEPGLNVRTGAPVVDCDQPRSSGDIAFCRQVLREKSPPSPSADGAIDCRDPRNRLVCDQLQSTGGRIRSPNYQCQSQPPTYKNLQPPKIAPARAATTNPLSLPTAPTTVTSSPDIGMSVSITKIKPEEQTAVSALDQVERTMANSSSDQLMQALNGLISPNGRASVSKSGSTPYSSLIDCTGNAAKRGGHSAVALLRKECSREYLAYFPDCIGTGQTTAACAILALFASRISIEGIETYCVGKTQEEQVSMGCL
jgi:hypothetical protein